MKEYIGFALLSFTSMFAMIDPLGLVPIYIAATSRYDDQHRRATVKRAILTAFLVLLTFEFLGLWIFRFFGVTPNAFRIAGGIVLFQIGLDMLRAKRSSTRTSIEEEEASIELEDIGIVPLGIPLIAGPGAITSVITFSTQAESAGQLVAITFAIILVLMITWLILLAAPKIAMRIGPTGLNVIERIIALIVVVIGVQFIVDGVEGAVLEFMSKAATS